MKSDAEIAIVGGGLVGLCAALALQHPDRQVHVIESLALAQRKATGMNSRSIALSGSDFIQPSGLRFHPEFISLPTVKAYTENGGI